MKLLIFTNYDSLRRVKSNAVAITDENENENPSELGILLQNSQIVCREKKYWKGYNDLSNNIISDFILIRDNIDYDVFIKLINHFHHTEYCVVYHRKPDDEKYNEIKNNKNKWKQGSHMPNNKLYQPIADAIINSNGKTDKDIVKDIDEKFKLTEEKENKIKSDYLFSIYNGKKIVENTLPDFVKDVQSELSTSIDWLSKNEYDNNNLITVNHFVLLRKALLNQA